jgi:hypothetical protein
VSEVLIVIKIVAAWKSYEKSENTRGVETLKSGTTTNWMSKTEKCEYTKMA